MCVKGVITLEKICAMPKIIILSREGRLGRLRGEQGVFRKEGVEITLAVLSDMIFWVKIF